MSGFLAFWLTGLVFLFCCGTMNASASVEFCPLAKNGGHCSKTKTDKTSPTFSGESETASFDCCAFLPQLFDKVRKIEKNQQTAQVTEKLKIDLPRFSIAVRNFPNTETYHSPLPAQQKIFIKNRVFRI